MANKTGKTIDKTSLSIDQAEARGFLHRDYIAHCFRWSHVVKRLSTSGRYKTARVLDVGCGKEMPLAKLLHSSRLAPEWYGAVDINKLTLPDQFARSTFKPSILLGETDVCNVTVSDLGVKPNVIVNFEVLEHVEPNHCRRMLRKFAELIDEDGTVFLSTPCYDEKVGAAANHVNEMTYEAFGAALEDTGFSIEGHWGTFASQKDYKNLMTPELQNIWSAFRDYYDSNMLSVIFAPLFPAQSRNCMWELKYNPGNKNRIFPPLSEVPGPWGSSEIWDTLDS